MAERTPEQIDSMVSEITGIISGRVDDPEHELFEQSLESPVISEEFRNGARSAMDVARFRGIVDGIRWATGEGELPDIEEIFKLRAAMQKYLSVEVLREILGDPSVPPDLSGGHDEVIAGG